MSHKFYDTRQPQRDTQSALQGMLQKVGPMFKKDLILKDCLGFGGKGSPMIAYIQILENSLYHCFL